MAGSRPIPGPERRARAARSNPDGRYEALARERLDDGWTSDPEPERLATTLTADASRTVIARNDSPDVPFDRSINPYRGCEHGCIYCFARPSHAWLGLSPGLDFESRLLYKPEAAARLRAELARPGYRCAPIALGSNTDPYQPVERRLGITRALLEVLAECAHPVQIVTKSWLIERDLELLAALAARRLLQVALSLTTLEATLARRMEPRAPSPARRLATIERLAAAGIPVSVLVAPVIPGLTEHELEAILEQARSAGASGAGYILLRLPGEVAGLFEEWLAAHYPERAARVLGLIRDTRGGRLDESRPGRRMQGGGPVAGLIEQRFRVAFRRLGFVAPAPLERGAFQPPRVAGGGEQLALL